MKTNILIYHYIYFIYQKNWSHNYFLKFIIFINYHFIKKIKTLKNDEILLFIKKFNKNYDIEKHMCVKSNNYLHDVYSIIYHYGGI
jgi:hypothetical protein